MTVLPALLAAAASLLLLSMAAVHIASKRRNVQRTLFALAALCTSGAMAALAIALASKTPSEVMSRLQINLTLVIFSPALTVPFFAFFGRDDARSRMLRILPFMITAGALLAAASLLAPIELVVNQFQIAEGGGLWRIGITPFGRLLALLALAVNVLILHLFENTYRSANVPAKVLLKYPLLGAIAATIMNFILMSRIVLLSETDGHYLSVGSLGVIFFCITFLYAGWRYPVFEVRTTLEKGKSASIVTVVVAGLYFLALAIITWTSNLIGVPYERFSLMVLSIFVVFVLLSVMISGRARRRLRLFINENFRPGRYNYRREWHHYARLMTSSSSIEDLLSNTISSLCETMIVKKGLIFAAVGGGKSADYGLDDSEIAGASPGEIMDMAEGSPSVFIAGSRWKIRSRGSSSDEEEPGGDMPEWIRIVSFLDIGGERKGFIALGRKDFGRSWTDEDRDFLVTITDQAALALENLLMEERYLESKQLESFNRFASFVVHDLKNTVGMLSLTADNARDNIHDRAFQEDAIDTIERSVKKMRRLIDSLNSHKAPAAISRGVTDVTDVAADSIGSLDHLASKKGVKILFESDGKIEAPVDKSAFSRIVENLVLNAVEAIEGGGTVTVSIVRLGDSLTLTVSDDGPGFNPEFLEEKLFRPFMSTKKNGLGVGLVLCKSLAEAHGGSISVSSSPGAGADVTVEMPAGN
jgi:putative PEP-CTERM system histidine kinase